MATKASIAVVGAAVAVLSASAAVYWFANRSVRNPEVVAALATPIGVTLQVLGNREPNANFRDVRVDTETAYADDRGMTFYTYDKDVEPGRSACLGDCAKTWPAALAPANASPVGDWSILDRGDGGRQWAYKRKPLYTSSGDARIGDGKGNGADGGLWHTAAFNPAANFTLPIGIAIKEVPDAEGQAFVDEHGMTLYAFDGDIQRDNPACSLPPCATHWIPFAAAQIANPIGDWSLISRDDGVQQWVYKGKPIYAYDGDLVPGDANGAGVDERWHVATVMRYFRPPEVSIRSVPGRGKVLATANGMTLYRHEGFLFRTGGHGVPRTSPTSAAMGREIGTRGCGKECLNVWRPLTAPADAQPSAYWEIVTREDGLRQWSYRGYPLYTYAGDKSPGDVNGYDIYDIAVNDGFRKTDYPVIPMNTQFSLYWTYAYP